MNNYSIISTIDLRGDIDTFKSKYNKIYNRDNCSLSTIIYGSKCLWNRKCRDCYANRGVLKGRKVISRCK